jgi:hypothetical protein
MTRTVTTSKPASRNGRSFRRKSVEPTLSPEWMLSLLATTILR